MLRKILTTTENVDWDQLAKQALESSDSGTDVLSVILSVLSLIAFIVALGTIAMIIYKSRKFMETKKSEDYGSLPALSKTLEIIMILLAIRVLFLIISIPMAMTALDSMDTIKELWGFMDKLPQEFIEAMQRATEEAKQDAITSYLTGIALIVGLFVLAIYAWHCFQTAKKLHAYLYPLGGIHMNPHAPINPANAVLPTDDELFGGTGSNALQGGADEAKMKELFGEEEDTNKSVSVPPKKEENTLKSDDDIFGNTNSSLFAGENKTEDDMNLFKKKEPKQEPIKAEPTKPANDDIFGSGNSSSFMQRDDEELERMRSLLLDDSPAAEKTEGAANDDVFGLGNTSTWGMVADENDPLLSQLLVNDEKPAVAEELKGGDIFGSDSTSAWGTVADEAMLEGVIAKDDNKEKEEPIKSDNIFGSDNTSGWGSMTDENDPLLNRLVASDTGKEEKYSSGDIFGEGNNSGWGSMTDESDLKGLIAEDGEKEEKYSSGDIFGGGSNQ